MNDNQEQKNSEKFKKARKMENFRNLVFIMAFICMVIFLLFFSLVMYEVMNDRLTNRNNILRHIANDREVTDSICASNPSQIDKHKSIVIEKSLCLDGTIVAKLNHKTDSLKFQINELKELYSNRQDTCRFIDYAVVGEQPVLLNLAKSLKGADIKLDQLIRFKGKIFLVVYGKIERNFPEGSFKDIFILCPLAGEQRFSFISEKWSDEYVQHFSPNDNGQNLRWTFDKEQINFILEHSNDEGQDDHPLYLNFDGKVLKNISLDRISDELLKSPHLIAF